LADTAFDSIRDAVLVIDSQAKHLPVMLANSAARGCFAEDSDTAELLKTSLFDLLAPASASAILGLFASLTEEQPTANRVLDWRLDRGNAALATELKMFVAARGPRLIMLTFAPSQAEPELASAVNQLPFDLLILDRDLKVTFANEGAVRASGVDGGDILGRSALSLAPTSALPREVYFRALEGCHYHDDAVKISSPRKPAGSFEVDVQPWKDATGVAGLLILSIEVSKRRMLSFQGASERRLSRLTENAGDIIAVATADGRLQYLSGGVRNILGFTSEEQHLTSIFEHAHPEDAGALRAKFQQLIAGEISRFSHQYRVRHKNGTYRWLDTVYVSALDDPLINGVMTNARDITESKRLEHEILEVSSRERQTIGRELHDGLGQELTGVALMLRGLATRIHHEAPAAVDYINEIVGLVNQSIETVRSLTHGLLSVRTDSGDLPLALRALAARSRDLYGLEVSFRAEMWPQLALDEASASHLYRIAQEALTNAARHGRATRVDILLSVSSDTFSLQITDDGTGIGKSDRPVVGMGLKTMKYRAGIIGAKFEIESNVPHGTVVRITGEHPTTVAAPYSVPAALGGP
jgi:PAS domain S-box-containing protein